MPYPTKEQRNAYQRAHYRANRDKRYEWNARHKQKLRAIIAEAKSVGCARCNEKHVACLDFHHRADKDFEISNAVGRMMGLDRLRREIAKCDVLCANCHRKEHAHDAMTPN